MARTKKKFIRRLTNKEFYRAVIVNLGALLLGVSAFTVVNTIYANKTLKQEMKLEKLADADTFETIEPLYDSKNDSVYFDVQDRKNSVDYGTLKGGNLKLYDPNQNLIFNKDFLEDETVEVKSEFLNQDRYRVKYSSFDDKHHYNITFGKK
jgi:hypothetical protein